MYKEILRVGKDMIKTEIILTGILMFMIQGSLLAGKYLP